MAFDPAAILLTDRVALVTGAARGCGFAIAETLARFGAHLVVCDRDGDALTAAVPVFAAAGEGRPVLARVLDVRDADAVAELLEAVTADHDRLDLLVNNAGGTFHAPLLDVSAKGEAALVAENFGQVTGLIRGAVPLMAEGGAIVNVTSIEAHQAAPGFAVYAAMKAAVASLTRTLALELAPRGIRVNAIAPDAVPTSGEDDLRAAVLAGAGEIGGEFDPAVLPPLGHFGRPDDVAAAAVFLASDQSRFVTGTTVHVDGGNWAAGGWRRTVLPDG
jgi:NAD(P)-dependent dehydrogenase (short-subunit alcohol dehydrogenase family)